MLAINPTYAFYVAYSCHTYTVAVGSLIYPMSGFTTFVKRNKQKKAGVFPRLPYKIVPVTYRPAYGQGRRIHTVYTSTCRQVFWTMPPE